MEAITTDYNTVSKIQPFTSCSKLLICLILSLSMVSISLHAVDPETKPKLVPGETFTIQFPGMPPTFFAIFEKKAVVAQMTIYLPKNYEPSKKFPLLIFLNGWDGGNGTTLGYALGLTEKRDFICVSMPLFKAPGYQASE